jgi:hypothetical protein
MKQSMRGTSRSHQRGGVAIIVGLCMVLLVGFTGLALDGGRLYLTKTELQNAADACALAASFELTGVPNIPAASFIAAENAGRLVATRNRVGFQTAGIVGGDVAIEFGTVLSGGAWSGAGGATPDSKYVRCTIEESGITPWFMQVLGFGDQTVRSLATATLAPSQNTCTALPLALCAPGSNPPDYGFIPGQWYSGGLGNEGQLTGSFGWIDFTPPQGGTNEAGALLRGTGACTVGPGAELGKPVGETGAKQALAKAWNTRFGIYHPSEPQTPVPDWSGYGYTSTNWPAQANAGPDFFGNRRPTNTPYGSNVDDGNAITNLNVSPNGSTVLQAPTLQARGGSRRVAPAPIVDCAAFETSQTVPVLDWGCVLMLHPLSGAGSGAEPIYVEFLGLATAPGSPCASMGGVGNSASTGPLVPALVQ